MGAGRSTRLHLTHLIPTSRLTLDIFCGHARGDRGVFDDVSVPIRGFRPSRNQRRLPFTLPSKVRQMYPGLPRDPVEIKLNSPGTHKRNVKGAGNWPGISGSGKIQRAGIAAFAWFWLLKEPAAQPRFFYRSYFNPGTVLYHRPPMFPCP